MELHAMSRGSLDRCEFLYNRSKKKLNRIRVVAASFLSLATGLVIFGITCYLVSTVNHLQHLVKSNTNVANEALVTASKNQVQKTKFELLDHRVDTSLQLVDVKNNKFNIEIQHLTRLVSIQNTLSVSLKRDINGLKENFETFKRKQNIIEKSIESAWLNNTSILEYQNIISNQTRSSVGDNNRNNDVHEMSTTNHPSLDYNHTLHNLIAMTNLSDYRLNELDAKLIKIHKTTEKNSQLLHKAAINSYFETSKLLSDNTSVGIIGDIDSVVLGMKEDLDKIKFLVTGRYSSFHIYHLT